MTDIEIPEVQVAKLPVLFYPGEAVESQVEDLKPAEVVCALETVACQLVVGDIQCLKVVGSDQQIGVQDLKQVVAKVQAL